jgi:hypothetical protein
VWVSVNDNKEKWCLVEVVVKRSLGRVGAEGPRNKVEIRDMAKKFRSHQLPYAALHVGEAIPKWTCQTHHGQLSGPKEIREVTAVKHQWNSDRPKAALSKRQVLGPAAESLCHQRDDKS